MTKNSKPLLVANWKMNPQTIEKAKEIASFLDNEKVIFCPPFVFLSVLKETIQKGKIGAQNCFKEKEGAFTGEISPVMLKEAGVKYVILGHSERRTVFEESSKEVNEKIKAAIEAGITPIVCIGESEECNESEEKTLLCIKEQLQETLQDVSVADIIIAYEPLFAIGSGNSCPVDLAERRKIIIQELVEDKNVAILYGGSVNSENVSSYLKEGGFDGVLVGGASLNPHEFLRIIESI